MWEELNDRRLSYPREYNEEGSASQLRQRQRAHVSSQGAVEFRASGREAIDMVPTG
jgi:hypothetical protein